MNIAYLIMAHHQPKLLARLIGSLTGAGAKFFVHIDRRAELAPFQSEVAGLAEVVFLGEKDRLAVSWGGFSQVEATLNLIHAARAHDVFERFCLLSGVDYPIRMRSEILREFEGDHEFIQIQRRLLPDGVMALERRVRRYYLGGHPATNFRTARPLVSKLLRKVEYHVPRKFCSGIDIYYGSNWWCLTKGAIEAILANIAVRADFVQWCRWTVCSDELFFQSLLKTTPFGAKVRYEYDARTQEDGETFPSMHYVDWWTGNPTAPKVLGLEDFPALRKSDALFARKFDEARSADLLELIDQTRNAQKPD